MRLSHDPLRITATFDDPNLVSRAGLAPVMTLAEQAGLQALVRRRVTITAKTGMYPDVKVGCLVAGMAAGADSIDDMDLLRHGAMPELFDGVRAPSTLGVVPALVHLGKCPPAGGGGPGVAREAGTAGAAAARRGPARVRGHRLDAAPRLRPQEQGAAFG
jgi:hypothetical protein